MSPSENKKYLVALDAGGTMTDTFLVDEDGNFSLGKYLTNYGNEAISYMGSVGDAASQLGLTSGDIHSNTDTSIYTGTIMLNILITGDGKTSGLLVTRGQGDTPFLERALTWLGRPPAEKWKLQLHEHTRPMIDHRNIVEVTERISGGNYFPPGSHYDAGHVIIPMHGTTSVRVSSGSSTTGWKSSASASCVRTQILSTKSVQRRLPVRSLPGGALRSI